MEEPVATAGLTLDVRWEKISHCIKEKLRNHTKREGVGASMEGIVGAAGLTLGVFREKRSIPKGKKTLRIRRKREGAGQGERSAGGVRVNIAAATASSYGRSGGHGRWIKSTAISAAV